MKSLLIALAIAGLSCLSFNANASIQPIQDIQNTLSEFGGGIIDIVSTATDIEIVVTTDTPGSLSLDIFDDSGRKIVGETRVVEGTTTFRFPKSIFAPGAYDVIVQFPTGTEQGEFKI